MTNEERLRAAGWRRVDGTNPPSSCEWSRDGIDWYTQAEALVEALTAERDAAIARAGAAEALAASRLDVSPEDADAYDKFVIAMFDGNAIPMAVWTRAERVRDALRAHAAKVS